MRQTFVIRVKEKEAELKDAEKEVKIKNFKIQCYNFIKKLFIWLLKEVHKKSNVIQRYKF